jgi:hypothetical protein
LVNRSRAHVGAIVPLRCRIRAGIPFSFSAPPAAGRRRSSRATRPAIAKRKTAIVRSWSANSVTSHRTIATQSANTVGGSLITAARRMPNPDSSA